MPGRHQVPIQNTYLYALPPVQTLHTCITAIHHPGHFEASATGRPSRRTGQPCFFFLFLFFSLSFSLSLFFPFPLFSPSLFYPLPPVFLVHRRSRLSVDCAHAKLQPATRLVAKNEANGHMGNKQTEKQARNRTLGMHAGHFANTGVHCDQCVRIDHSPKRHDTWCVDSFNLTAKCKQLKTPRVLPAADHTTRLAHSRFNHIGSARKADASIIGPLSSLHFVDSILRMVRIQVLRRVITYCAQRSHHGISDPCPVPDRRHTSPIWIFVPDCPARQR
ncbi:hypothetical protein LX36DRAFT_388330 [Colletotrichum falcatum]|nr:hypothetical protein LX36DRAFT_388330 [Colletotrichum falcatum]